LNISAKNHQNRSL